MRNSVQLSRNHNASIRTGIADRLGHLLSRKPPPPPMARDQIREAVDQIRDQEYQVLRLQMMEQETTDPMAARLLQDIISEMEAELKEQVDRLAAERQLADG
jgi:hypothetical protein